VSAETQSMKANKIHSQAADALRLVGVGRNEYIAILNACKNRRVMWRVNRCVVGA